MEASNCLFVIACILALGLIPIGFATLVFNICTPASRASGGPGPWESFTGDPWVERGLKGEDGNLTIKGYAYFDGLDGEFDGRVNSPKLT